MSWEAGDIQGPDMGYDFGGQSGCDDGHSSEFTGAGDREEVCRHQERSYQAHGRASCALAIWAGGCGAGVETGCQDGSDGRPLVCKTGKYSSDQRELERAEIHSLCFAFGKLLPIYL